MKKQRLTKLLVGVIGIIVLFPFTTHAQENEGGTPLSFGLKTSSNARQSFPTYTTAAIPLERLQAEDAIFDKGKYPYRFGYNFDVSLDIKKEGALEELADGSKIWRFKVQCPGALSINFLYSNFHLPEGAKLYQYTTDGSIILGAYTKRNNQPTGKFGTETIASDEVIIEYSEPTAVEFPGEVVLAVIVHGYRSHASALLPQAAGNCNVNINCPEAAGWENQKRAVARLIMNGNTLCTGTLINNARNDDKPYFMTANHCIGSLDALSNADASGYVFYWNFESASCAGTTGPETQTTSGAKIRANNSASDFALLELNAKPAAAYNVFYAGWNRSTTPSNGAVGIHHPAGDIKKFSRDASTLQVHDNSFWLVPSWDLGVTEGGSSGSAIFDFNKRFIGQLLGGSSGCGSSDQSDIYGQFAYSWDKGGNVAGRRLKDWLDPDNTGAITIDGKNPGTVTNNPPSVTITAPADQTGLTAPASFTITAAANDTDGTISKVDFYNGTTLLGSDATAPFSYSWNNVGIGNYSITAVATDNGGAKGTSGIVNVLVVTLRTPENPISTAAGLDYKYYEGDWSQLPNFNSLTAIKTGTTPTLDLTQRNRDDDFGFRFTGFINVPTDGVYTFYTSSDDGSQLFIGSTLVVNNDGLHGETEVSGVIGLKAGKHALTVTFFENAADQVLTASYKGPGINKQVIPAAALFRSVTVTNVPPSVSLTAPTNNATFTAPATINITANASDVDGTVSKMDFYNGNTLLGSDATAPYAFSWTNVAAGTYTITAKATDNSNAISTSVAITIQVNVAQPSIATVYKHCNYDASGYGIGLNVGDYTLAQLIAKGISDNDISSIKIQSGYEIVLYTEDNFTGTSLVVRADNTCLVNNNYNDVATSVRVRLIPVNQNPTISLSTNGTTFSAPAAVTLSANATDADGTVTKVEFYNGTTRLGEDLTSPYAYTWTGVTAGSYTLTAKVTDNEGSTVASTAITITVTATNDCGSLPQYQETTGNYVAGSKVQNAGQRFECKPWPYSGWCNGAGWAYAPGTGAYWTDAWTLLAACATKSDQWTKAITNTLSIHPNPAHDVVTIDFKNAATIDVQLFDTYGHEIIRQSIKANESLNVSQLSSGVYMLRAIIDGEVLIHKIIKQ